MSFCILHSLLLGCQGSYNHSKEKSMDKVIKIHFSEWTIDERPYSTAIDIENNEVYVDPIMSRRGLRAHKIVKIENASEVIDLLKIYDVQSWRNNYTFEDPRSYEDGYSWGLWLQFEDGMEENYAGEGTDIEKITPKNLRAFVKELTEFVEVKLRQSEER